MDKKAIAFRMAVPYMQVYTLFDTLRQKGLITSEEFNSKIDKLIEDENEKQNISEEDLKEIKAMSHMI